LSARLVGDTDDGAFDHVGVRQQRGLHLGAGDVVTGRDDHVVGAGGEVEAAILVLDEAVAGQVPAVADIVALALVGEIAAAGGTAHGEPAHRAARNLVHVVVHR